MKVIGKNYEINRKKIMKVIGKNYELNKKTL